MEATDSTHDDGRHRPVTVTAGQVAAEPEVRRPPTRQETPDAGDEGVQRDPVYVAAASAGSGPAPSTTSVAPIDAPAAPRRRDPGTYPVEWEADVVLADGTTAHLRPIRPDDADALERFHERQSPESVYLRFFAAIPRLSAATLDRFTHLDYRDRAALVATIAGQIVGVGRYDRIEATSAEAALAVSDAHHARGLGSVLLEHLAAAARENGIHQFVADILPQNRPMLAVLRDIGYEISRRYADGVISLSFPIDPTEKSRAVMEAREHRAEAVSVRALLNPTSMVLAGASRREGTIGHHLLQNILAAGFTGTLSVVHREADAVLGVPAVRRLADVSAPLDLAIIAIPVSGVKDMVVDCAAKGVRGLVLVSGGYAEQGPEGLALQHELVAIARESGMRVIGPNSWGVINTDAATRLNVSLLPDLPTSGRLGVFTQSTASSVLALDVLTERGVGLSTFVSTGNRADVSSNDCLQYWEEDAGTDVVGLYLEGLGNPRKFLRIARRLNRRKPIIVVTMGQGGASVPPDRTIGYSRAPQQALDALLAQSGCIPVDSARQLVDVAQVLLSQPLPAGPRVAIVANTHGLGSSVADTCAQWGLEPRPSTVLGADATPQDFRFAIEAAFGAEDVDAVVAAFVPPLATQATQLADMLSSIEGTARQPVVACFLGMPGIRAALPPTGVHAVPTYPTPDDAVRALALACRYRAWTVQDPGVPVAPDDCDPVAVQALIEQALAAHPDGVDLDPGNVARVLDLYGVHLWPALPVTDRHDAVAAANQVGWPVALKATAPQLRHRVDLGGVQLGIGGPSELADHIAAMRSALRAVADHDLVVQHMASAGVACVIGTVEDPLFGPVVSFGVAGDASELLGDVACRVAPLTDRDIAELITSVRAAPRLFGHRGAQPVDVAALQDVIARVAHLADAHPQIARLDLNPVVVSEQSAAVLGASIRLAPGPGRPDTGRRELTST